MKLSIETLEKFFQDDSAGAEQINNERSLQLELGIFLRRLGLLVQFERPFKTQAAFGSTRAQKTNLDIWVSDGSASLAIELKVPLAGRVPETLYDFCADISFIEALIATRQISSGCCVLVTSNRQFWTMTPNQETIYDAFHRPGSTLGGNIAKPTGPRNSCVVISGAYDVVGKWKELGNQRLLPGGRYILIPIRHGQ